VLTVGGGMVAPSLAVVGIVLIAGGHFTLPRFLTALTSQVPLRIWNIDGTTREQKLSGRSGAATN
jgi:hypothetical protein